MSTILSRHPLYVDKDIPSKYYLESEQQEFVEDISQAKEKLKMLAAASPSEIVSKDEDPLYSLSSTVIIGKLKSPLLQNERCIFSN